MISRIGACAEHTCNLLCGSSAAANCMSRLLKGSAVEVDLADELDHIFANRKLQQSRQQQQQVCKWMCTSCRGNSSTARYPRLDHATCCSGLAWRFVRVQMPYAGGLLLTPKHQQCLAVRLDSPAVSSCSRLVSNQLLCKAGPLDDVTFCCWSVLAGVNNKTGASLHQSLALTSRTQAVTRPGLPAPSL